MKILIIELKKSVSSENVYPIWISVKYRTVSLWTCYVYPLENWNSWSDQDDTNGIDLAHLFENGRDGYIICREMNAIFNGKTLFVEDKQDEVALDKLFSELSIKKSFLIKQLGSLAK